MKVLYSINHNYLLTSNNRGHLELSYGYLNPSVSIVFPVSNKTIAREPHWVEEELRNILQFNCWTPPIFSYCVSIWDIEL